MCDFLDLGAQGCGYSFTLFHALLKMGILLPKEATVQFILNTVVSVLFHKSENEIVDIKN